MVILALIIGPCSNAVSYGVTCAKRRKRRMITDGTALGDVTPSRFSFLFFPSFTFHLQMFSLIMIIPTIFISGKLIASRRKLI